MKTKMIGLAALSALTFGLAMPANAHQGDLNIALRLGPAYVYYGDGFHRVDRQYRYGPRNRYRHFAATRRYIRERDLWHHCFDGRWYRYYDRRHWRFHEKRRHTHRMRRGHRHRHW